MRLKHPTLPVWCSPDGRVFGRKGELKTRMARNGYKRFNTVAAGKHVTVPAHKAVAEAFFGLRPEGMTVNHKDGDRLNNSVSNLEYLSAAENTTHAFRNGLVGTCIAVEFNGVRYHSLREAERQTGIPRKLVRRQTRNPPEFAGF